MKVYPTMRAQWSGLAPGTPGEVAARIQEGIDARTLAGEVDDERLKLTVIRSGKNSWRPILSGRLEPCGADATWVELTLAVHPFVLVFTIVHGFMLLGLAWMMGIYGFSSEAEKALETFAKVSGAEPVVGTDVLARQVLGAPDAPGAEAHAPWSLRAQLENQSVRFRLSSPGMLPGTTRRTTLVVDAMGIQADGVAVAWSAIRGVEVLPGALLVTHDAGTARLLAANHSERDIRWLADYLAASAARTGVGSEDERRLRTEAGALASAAQRRGRATEGGASS